MPDHNYLLYIAVFSTASAVSSFVTPFTKKLALKVGAVDYPKDRGLHNKPMPRLGGCAIVIGFFVALLITYSFFKDIFPTKQFLGFLLSLAIIVILGFIDDIRNLRAKTKLFVQIIAGLVVIASGIRINFVMWPFTIFLQALSVPITLLWIIGVTNAVNLIDGLDGLAAGVSSIAALCIMVLCALTGSELAVILTASLAGSCLGFLPRNFNPAETFMGDTGSTFLGFVLAVTSIMGVFKGYAFLAVALSFLTLGLPIFDTFFAMGRRILKHQPIMQPDRGHLHHRLIDRGFSQRQAVIILYSISFFFGMTAILIAVKSIWATAVSLMGFLLLSIFVYSFIKKKKQSTEQNNG